MCSGFGPGPARSGQCAKLCPRRRLRWAKAGIEHVSSRCGALDAWRFSRKEGNSWRGAGGRRGDEKGMSGIENGSRTAQCGRLRAGE